MATTKTLRKKLVKTASQIDKLLKNQRKNAIELCTSLAKDLAGRMGEDKLREELESDSVFFETRNYFDSAETIEDKPTTWRIVGVSKKGILANDDNNDGEFAWKELETETIDNLTDILSDIHVCVSKHIQNK